MTADLPTCSGCGAPVRWVLTVGGRRMPLDPDPHPDGNVVRVTIDGGLVRAKVLTGAEMPAQDVAWRAHWTTCPASEGFRRRKTATTPRCVACRRPLDAGWAAAGHRYHVLCAPPGPGELRAAVAAHATPPAAAPQEGPTLL